MMRLTGASYKEKYIQRKKVRKKRKAVQATSSDFPQAFLQQMSELLEEEYNEFYECLFKPAMVGLRVNNLKLSPKDFQQISPYKLLPIPWCKSGFSIETWNDPYPPGKHPFHAAGLYYMQEPSAMIAAEVLHPQPGELVLDLAAAPGGKSTHLASLMNNTGVLIANDIHPKRVWDLAENIERCGVTNAIVVNESPERLADYFGEYFDRVLLDAPCSGEGMFRRNPSARAEWSPELPHSCAIRQSTIMEYAARLVKPGGSLAYTTCTFSLEENEYVIAKFLNDHHEFDIMPNSVEIGLAPSRPELIGLPPDHKINLARRIWPHQTRGEGHFIALFTKINSSCKKGGANRAKSFLQPKQQSRKISESVPLTLLNDFYHDHLNIHFEEQRIYVAGSYIYQIPEYSPSLHGLRVIHPGWWLGMIQKYRFIPSHALSLGIHSRDAQQVLQLQHGDDRVMKYLHGETIDEAGSDGWVLITMDDFPLGWGKRSHGIIKNYYPRGLRHIS